MTDVLVASYAEPRRALLPAVRSAVLALAAQEAWRVVRHPAGLLGLLLWIGTALSVGGDGADTAFDLATAGPTWFYGVAVLFAANLVASRDRRAHSGELLSSTPVSAQSRTVALLLAAAGPAAVCAAVVVLLDAAFSYSDLYVVPPTTWHLLQAPLTVLGAGLLGVMVARWAPVPGAMLLVLVALVAANVYPANNPDPWTGLGIHASWVVWTDGPAWAGVYPGSVPWHCAYLAGLCAMAATGALVPGARRRGLVVTVGAALTAATAVAAWVQLP